MRRVLPIIIGGLVAARMLTAAENLSADDLLSLDGRALFQAADKADYSLTEKFSTTDLIRIADKLARERKNVSGKDDDWVFTRFFEAACEKATPEEIDQLVDIYVRLEPGSFEKTYSLQALAAAWAARELAGLNSTTVNLPDLETPVPPELEGAPKDLVAGLKLWMRASQPLDHHFAATADDDKRISFQDNEVAFYRVIDDILLKRGQGSAERLSEFGWGGWCGTGSDSLHSPQSLGLFLALLGERRIPEAIGAAVKLRANHGLVAGGADVRITFLEKCGLDWDSLFAGALLNLEEDGFLGTFQAAYLSELGAYGSEKGAALVAELAVRAKPEVQEDYARALTAFLPEPIKERMEISSRNITRVSKTPISTETRAKVIRALEQIAKPEATADAALAALEGLSRAKLDSTKGTLRALLKHHSVEVVRSAAQILRSMGDSVELSAADTAAVRFQLLANGQPLRKGFSLSWSLGYVSSVGEIGDDGTFELEQSHFRDPTHRPTSLVFETSVFHQIPDPYFRVEIPLPTALDKETRVDIELLPVALVFSRAPRPAGSASAKASVRIQRHDPKAEAVYFTSMDPEFDVPMDAPFQLSIQSGTYDIEARSPGTEKFKQTFTVTPQTPSRVDVQLRPGGDMHFTIVRPDGDREVRSELLRQGRKVGDIDLDYNTNTYRGLPVGDYVLHIPSSAEIAADKDNFPEFAPLQPYAGKDMPFTISSDTALVELGEIRLDPAD